MIELEKAPPSPTLRKGIKRGEEGAGLLGNVEPAAPMEHFTVRVHNFLR
jgi:hypothetical protein